MKTASCATLLSLILAQPALAEECPTRADLAQTGIRFDIEGGEWEVFRAFGDGVVSSLYHGADTGEPLRVLLGQGVYLLETADLKGGTPDPATRYTYSYPMPPAEMPLPTPGGRFAVSAAVMGDGDLRREDQAYTFGPEIQATFGTCSYRAMEITITYDGDDSTRDTLLYLPDLGISYLSGSVYPDGRDSYTYLAIRKAD